MECGAVPAGGAGVAVVGCACMCCAVLVGRARTMGCGCGGCRGGQTEGRAAIEHVSRVRLTSRSNRTRSACASGAAVCA